MNNFQESDFDKIRQNSLLKAKKLGYPTNKNLPLLEETLSCRSEKEIIDRCLSLLAVVACSFGLKRNIVISWINEEQLTNALSKSEYDYIFSRNGKREDFQKKIEGLFCFAWCLRFSEDMDFDRVCVNNLVKLFPDLKNQQCSELFRSQVSFRDTLELLNILDLAYCLHWGIRDSQLNKKRMPGQVNPYVVVERRRGLEWVLSTQEWDDISLDT